MRKAVKCIFICLFIALFSGGGAAVAASIPDPKFTITTTDMPAGASISFELVAKGALQIDWGDGVVESANGRGAYSHTYVNAGTYTIGMTGTLTDQGQTTIKFDNNPYIEKLGGAH